MTIKIIKSELKSAKNPVTKAIDKSAGFRVLAMGFKKGMFLKPHTAKWPSKLTVLEGCVSYQEENKRIQLQQYDEYDIPVGVIHSVEAEEDSLCLLIQRSNQL